MRFRSRSSALVSNQHSAVGSVANSRRTRRSRLRAKSTARRRMVAKTSAKGGGAPLPCCCQHSTTDSCTRSCASASERDCCRANRRNLGAWSASQHCHSDDVGDSFVQSLFTRFHLG